MAAEVSTQWTPIAKLAARKAVWLVFHKRLLSWQDLSQAPEQDLLNAVMVHRKHQ